MALRRFGGDPLGRRVSLDDGRSWTTIVGLVNDVKHYGLETSAVEEIYLPFDRYAPLSATLVVRTGDDPKTLLRRVEDAVRTIDPRQPVSRVRTLDDVRDASVAPVRMTTTLVTGLAAIALFISAAGVAGAAWFSVNQRNHDIGVRLALGESPALVAFRVVGVGLGPVAAGLVCGLPVAWAAARIGTAGDVFRSIGPGTMAAAALAIMAVATIACVAPARRAASISPIDALRTE
jgi:ABC-type antimicrobial peptide transport system permease subunit